MLTYGDFGIDLNFFYKCFYFHSTSGRTYQLQAKDKQTMMFWLQELQVLAAAILIVWSDA